MSPDLEQAGGWWCRLVARRRRHPQASFSSLEAQLRSFVSIHGPAPGRKSKIWLGLSGHDASVICLPYRRYLGNLGGSGEGCFVWWAIGDYRSRTGSGGVMVVKFRRAPTYLLGGALWRWRVWRLASFDSA